MKCRYCFTSLVRGSYRAEKARGGEVTGHCCRSELACFNRILAQRNVFLRIGNQMSNACYNLSQSTWSLSDHDKGRLAKMQTDWDAEKRRYL